VHNPTDLNPQENNEANARYSIMEPIFYVPDVNRNLVQQGKPGHYEFVPGTVEQHALAIEQTKKVCVESVRAYENMLEAGIAREAARGVWPVCGYSSMFATCNARSLMHFLSLRTKNEDSKFPSYPQREIEMVAEQMEEQFAELMPLTNAAFQAAGRVAP
jgi:thymidylate synthase (FAD)